jgi:hypothetical protein
MEILLSVNLFQRTDCIINTLLTYLLVLFVPTGTQGLNNFTIVEVSIAVIFFLQRQGC